MKIAITGGAGFIGSRLTKQLTDLGHEIVIIDTAGDNPIDVTDEAAMMGALRGVDVIYNLAAQHRDDVRPKQLYYDVNVGGAEVIVKAAKAHGIKTIIFTSTVAVYGLDAGESKESDTPAPFNDYGRSKLQAEDVFNAWQAENPDEHSLVTLRLVATFGPGNRGNVFTLIDQIARGRFVMVGNGSNAKSLAYVENVAAFLTHCLTLKTGAHVYNYADKPDMIMRDMVSNIRRDLGQKSGGLKIPYPVGLIGGFVFDRLAGLTGKTFPISSVRVKKFCANTIVNSDKRNETGFTAPYTLEHGLNEMIAADFIGQDQPVEQDKAA